MRFGVEYGGVRFPYRMTADDPDGGNIQRVIQAGARLPKDDAQHFPILIASEDIWHTAAVRGGLDETAVYWCRYENAPGQTWGTRNPGDRSTKLNIQRIRRPKHIEKREAEARASMRAEGREWEVEALEVLRSQAPSEE